MVAPTSTTEHSWKIHGIATPVTLLFWTDRSVRPYKVYYM